MTIRVEKVGKMKPIKGVEIVEVIRVRAVVGEGTKEDPVREVFQYWEKSGKKIAERINCGIAEDINYDEISFEASKQDNSVST